MPVCAGHNQIGVYFLRNADQLACDGSRGMLWLAYRGGYVVPREVSGHIIYRRVRRRFVAVIKYFNNRYGHGLTDQRQ